MAWVFRQWQLRALGFVRGGLSCVEFVESLVVRVIAHRFREGSQEVVANFQAVALAPKTAVDEPQLLLRSDLGVSAVLMAP